MDLNVGKELAALRRMPVRDLQSRYAEVFGETTNTHHKAMAGQAHHLATATLPDL
jgi:hypothetical protein